MHITSAEFVKGVVGEDRIFEITKPHIAFVGRSNVGKSSLINSLVSRKDLARSSSAPGKTREINFYLINKKYYFVDLPGYGFARASRHEQEKIRHLILWYLFDAAIDQRKVVLIVDANVGPTEFDTQMRDEIERAGIGRIVVANKIDKLKKSQFAHHIDRVQYWAGDTNVIPYSVKTREGRGELWKQIMRIY